MVDPVPGEASDPVETEALPASLSEVALDGRRALLRVDVNAPVEDGVVEESARLRAAAASIRALLDAGAGVVVLGHQGRPGRDDFVPLDQHAALVGGILGVDVGFVPDVAGEKAVAAVRDVSPGQVLFLDNVRGAEGEIENVDAEVHAERAWVRALAAEADVFVLDAFPASHRSHASLVGFPLLLPAAMGPVMEAELSALQEAAAREGGERLLVLGGAKVEDALKVLNHHLEGGLIDEALVGGIVGELFLMARGNSLGGSTEALLERLGASDFLSLPESLVERFDRFVVTPLDVAYSDGGDRGECFIEELPSKHKLLDVGEASAQAFAEAIEAAETVVLNGPMGAYEQEGFELGTRRVVEACAKTQAFTVLGGGHTVAALERFGFSFEDFDHVSLAGGALITYLTGDPLPGIEALAESKRKFALGAR
ncbi:MAG: phosphoglycerate kinase [Candidatus Thermoplasmatota archaeon]|nr:phosphoglycerate kinase [Candidatus Thermoplasmatota archaeon]